MSDVLQTYSREIHGLAVTTRAVAGFESNIEALFDTFASHPAERLTPGTQTWVAFGPVFWHPTEAGSVQLRTPDYLGDSSGALTNDLTLPLRIGVQQGMVHEVVGAPMQQVSYGDTLIIASGVLDQSAIYLHRKPPTNDRDSGWFIGPTARPAPGAPPVEYERLYVNDLLRQRPDLVRLLTLPTEHLVVLDGTEIRGVQDPTGRELWPAGA